MSPHGSGALGPQAAASYLYHDVRVAGAVLQILLRAIRGHRREALVAPALQPGSAASRPARSRQFLSSLWLLPQRPPALPPRRARRRVQQGRRRATRERWPFPHHAASSRSTRARRSDSTPTPTTCHAMAASSSTRSSKSRRRESSRSS
jgi:hypothetical protein